MTGTLTSAPTPCPILPVLFRPLEDEPHTTVTSRSRDRTIASAVLVGSNVDDAMTIDRDRE